jgi:hypothetical protein
MQFPAPSLTLLSNLAHHGIALPGNDRLQGYTLFFFSRLFNTAEVEGGEETVA